MKLLNVIRRMSLRLRLPIRQIARRTGLSRNTVKKHLRADTVEPKCAISDRPPDPGQAEGERMNEAREALRGPIEKIVLIPRDDCPASEGLGTGNRPGAACWHAQVTPAST